MGIITFAPCLVDVSLEIRKADVGLILTHPKQTRRVLSEPETRHGMLDLLSSGHLPTSS